MAWRTGCRCASSRMVVGQVVERPTAATGPTCRVTSCKASSNNSQYRSRSISTHRGYGVMTGTNRCTFLSNVPWLSKAQTLMALVPASMPKKMSVIVDRHFDGVAAGRRVERGQGVGHTVTVCDKRGGVDLASGQHGHGQLVTAAAERAGPGDRDLVVVDQVDIDG